MNDHSNPCFVLQLVREAIARPVYSSTVFVIIRKTAGGSDSRWPAPEADKAEKRVGGGKNQLLSASRSDNNVASKPHAVLVSTDGERDVEGHLTRNLYSSLPGPADRL